MIPTGSGVECCRAPAPPLPHRLSQQQKEPGRSQVTEERKKKKSCISSTSVCLCNNPSQSFGQDWFPTERTERGNSVREQSEGTERAPSLESISTCLFQPPAHRSTRFTGTLGQEQRRFCLASAGRARQRARGCTRVSPQRDGEAETIRWDPYSTGEVTSPGRPSLCSVILKPTTQLRIYWQQMFTSKSA